MPEGQEGQIPLRGLNLGAAKRLLGEQLGFRRFLGSPLQKVIDVHQYIIREFTLSVKHIRQGLDFRNRVGVHIPYVGGIH